MNIPGRVDEAVRLMVELEDHSSEPVPLGALSASRSVPVASLMHLLSDPRRHDLVVSVRGPTGGCPLARPPAEIALSDVVLDVNGPPTVADWRPAQLTCAGPASSLATVWLAGLGCVAAVLDGVTVEQLRSGRLPSSVQRLHTVPRSGHDGGRFAARERFP